MHVEKRNVRFNCKRLLHIVTYAIMLHEKECYDHQTDLQKLNTKVDFIMLLIRLVHSSHIPPPNHSHEHCVANDDSDRDLVDTVR